MLRVLEHAELQCNHASMGCRLVQNRRRPHLVPCTCPIGVSTLVRRRVLVDMHAGAAEAVQRADAAEELVGRRAEDGVYDGPDDAADATNDAADETSRGGRGKGEEGCNSEAHGRDESGRAVE